jgi:hypothetical protein
MELYHGSDVAVKAPHIIINPSRTLDFGSGFYTTTSREQAVGFTENVNRRNGTKTRVISVYDFDERNAVELTFLRFKTANADWLDFVTQNRIGTYRGADYDVVIGAVANDNVYTTLILYADGTLSKEATIEALKTKRLFNQYAFRSEKALALLRFQYSFFPEGDEK